MTTDLEDIGSMPQLLQYFQSSLKTFAKSPSTFQLLKSIPASHGPDLSPAPQTLYVLDSSYNPPTIAHLRIASSALESDPRGSVPKRLLLLLATENADKPSKPAAFEHRLAMMTLFAQDLLSRSRSRKAADHFVDAISPIDVGVTKKPYFVDKATAVSESNVYGSSSSSSPEQVHLTGFDTMIRIFNPRYYPPDHTLAPLEPFLRRHRVRVTYRPDDEWGGKEEQDAYVAAFARGEMEKIGGRREWSDRIDLVEGKRPGEMPVSSTKARSAAARGDGVELGALVTPAVKDWILSNDLYKEDI